MVYSIPQDDVYKDNEICLQIVYNIMTRAKKNARIEKYKKSQGNE